MADNNTKMNISYTIKAVDRFTAVHKRLEQQLDSVERQADKLDKTKQVDVTAKTTDFERKLLKAQIDLGLIDDKEIELETDVKPLLTEIKAAERHLKRMRKEYEIKINTDVSASEDEIAQLHKQLRIVDAKLKQLDRQKAHVNVTATTFQAMRQLENVEDKMRRISVRRAIVNVAVTGYKDARQKLDRIAGFSRNISEVLSGFMTGGIITTIAPALEVLAGGLGAVASSAGSAALGFGGFLAVAIPSISKVTGAYGELKDARQKVSEAKTEEELAEALEELEAVQSKYNETQLRSVDALSRFNSFFDEFVSKFEKPILLAFNQSLGTAQALLVLLEPAIEGVVTAVSNLISKFNENLNTEDMQQFFDWVGETAGPNFEKLVSAVGNFLAGFGNMMVEFDPLAQSFMDGFLEMSESFRDWSASLEENQAFQDFMDAVKEHTPVVLEFIGKLATALWETIEAMAPFAVWALEVANSFLAWYNENMKTNEAFSKFIGFTTVAIGALSMFLAPIILISSMLKTVFGPLIGMVAGLFKDKLTPNVGKGKEGFGKFGGMLSKVLPWIGRIGQWLLRLMGPMGWVATGVIALAGIFDIGWSDIANGTKVLWEWMPDFITDTMEWIWTSVSNGFKAIGDFITGSSEETVSKVSGDLDTLSTSYDSSLGKIDSTTSSKFSSIDSTVGSSSWFIQDTVNSSMNSMENDFIGTFQTLDSETYTKLSSMGASVDSGMSDMFDITSGTLSDMELDFADSLSSLDSDLYSEFENMSSNVDFFMGDMEDYVSTGWSNAESEASTATSKIANKTGKDFQSQLRAVNNALNQIDHKIRAIWGQIQSYLKGINLASIGRNLMQGFVSGISGMAGRLISSVTSPISSAIGKARGLLGIKSPSRVFKRIGEFTGEGMIIGMDKMESGIIGASKRMAQAAVPGKSMTQPKYLGINTDHAPNRGYRSDDDSHKSSDRNTEPITQNLYFYGDATSTPSETARKNKQALRNWAMEANF